MFDDFESDTKFFWFDIVCDLFQILVFFCVLLVVLHYRIVPNLYQTLESSKEQSPVILDGFVCHLDKDLPMPLHDSDLVDLGLLKQSDVDAWDQHEEYLFDGMYQTYYKFSGVMAYANGRWYTKSVSIDLSSVQADKHVVGMNGLYLNDSFDASGYDFLFRLKDSGAYRVYGANATAAFDRPDSVQIYVDRYTDIISMITYTYDDILNIKEPQAE